MTTILHIEDQNDFRRDLCFMLQEKGFNTIEAVDGKEGLRMFNEKNPDIILCDIKIPKLSGYEVLRNIRFKNNYNPYVPFIFLSGLKEDSEIAKSSRLLADDYLTKPTPLSVLVEKINCAIANHNPSTNNTSKHFDLKKEIESITGEILSNKTNLLKQIAVNIENGLPPLEIDRQLFSNATKDILQRVLELSNLKDKTSLNAEYNYDNECISISIYNKNLDSETASQILLNPSIIKLLIEKNATVYKREHKGVTSICIDITDD